MANNKELQKENVVQNIKNEIDYVPLRIQTNYSLQDSIIKPKELIDFAVENNFPSIAITDKDNFFSAAEYCFYARKRKYPGILGANISTDSGNILLYCQNEAGYKNLCRIMSENHIDYNLEFPLNKLEEYSEGLLVLAGTFDEGVLKNSPFENTKKLYKIFKDRLFLELNRTEGKDVSESIILELSQQYSLPIVAVTSVKYMSSDDANAYQVVQALKAGETIDDENKAVADNFRLLTRKEMMDLYSDCPVAIENTLVFAQKCRFLLKEIKPRFAFFDENEDELLIKWSKEGLEKLISRDNWYESIKDSYESKEDAQKQYFERLEYELDMIVKLGFPGYFLIVADFVRWAKENGISLSARGSGAGSLVAWSLRITVIDPIAFGLFFERFINPGRVSLPDFDIDFCQERRGEVIEYVSKKYGHELIAQIITFGSWHARGALRDTGRVLHIPYGVVDQICKRIPNSPNFSLTLSEALESDKELQEQCEKNTQIDKMFKISMKLEGLNRHVSTHAAGIIIGYDKLKDIVPLYSVDGMQFPATQYSMSYVEKAGLVKFDFLGLTALTIIDRVAGLLKKKDIDLDVNNISLADDNVFAILRQGLTAGVFQFESVGLTNVLKELQPTVIDELVATISLYRPGPMENIPLYLSRKRGEIDIEYEYPALQDILKETFGIIIYQEQVIAIAKVLAGYTLSEADLLRRAMGKKIPKEMEEQREKFTTNVVKGHGDTKEKADDLFEQIIKFSGYAFNKAHAASHALIGYQTAYLKTYYPLEFMAVSLTLEKDRQDKIALLAKEFKALNLKLVKPDILRGENDFKAVYDHEVLFSLSAIKSVGEIIVKDIVELREKRELESVENIHHHVRMSKGVLEALTCSGAFDEMKIYAHKEKNSNICEHRAELLSNIDLLLGSEGEGLFDTESEEKVHFSETDMILKEFKYCGVIFSMDVLESMIKDALQNQTKIEIVDSCEVYNYCKENNVRQFYIAGVVLSTQLIKTRQGSVQWVIKLADMSSVYELFLKREIFEESGIELGQVWVFNVSVRKNFWIVEKVIDSRRLSSDKVCMMFPQNRDHLEKIQNYLRKLPTGVVKCVLKFEDNAEELVLGHYDIISSDIKNLSDFGFEVIYKGEKN